MFQHLSARSNAVYQTQLISNNNNLKKEFMTGRQHKRGQRLHYNPELPTPAPEKHTDVGKFAKTKGLSKW